MEPINCLIIDDEPLAQDIIESRLKKHPQFIIKEKCDDAATAFRALHQHKIDVIFLDIHMPVITGLNFLKSLNNPPLAIFTTAYSEYAVEGFELNALDYLLKPISQERFDKAIQKIMDKLSATGASSNPIASTTKSLETSAPQTPAGKSKDFIFVKCDGKLVKVLFSEIVFCEGMKDYLKIHLSTGKYLVIHQTMKGMEELLPSSIFMRVHKSYIVSIPAIKSFHDNTLQFSAQVQQEIPVSNSYKEELLKRLAG